MMIMQTRSRAAARCIRVVQVIGSLLVTQGLISCTIDTPRHTPISIATVSQPKLAPAPGQPIAVGVRVQMDAEYVIASFDPAPGAYYAVSEIHASDHRTLYLRGCGHGSRITLSKPNGNLRLHCHMKVPVVGDENPRHVHLALRLYQRTGRDVSEMIASSEPIDYQVRNNDAVHRALPTLSPCAEILQDDGRVHICRD
jgi:hypothetical protein